MIITWKITQTDYVIATGFITIANWTATAVDGEYAAATYGQCTFAGADPAIPYDQVTEQEVLDWCWATGVDKDAVEANLAVQILAQQNPVTAVGVPWSN
jgi:hypothetical protein